MARVRADVLVVEQGLAQSRSRAQALILAGVVLTADGRAVDANATAARRDALRTERAWSSPPVVAWDNAGAANALDAAE